MMQPLRRKCVYKRSENFKVILNQFFNSGKQLVPDDVMNAIRNEIHNGDNILYYYKINKMAKYKNSIYFIFFTLNDQPFHTSRQKRTI